MRGRLNLDEYISGVRENNRVLLGKAITLIESTQPSDQEMAFEMMEALMPFTGNSRRFGITGVPGVGKSTFIEVFGLELVETHGKKVAVLAIDPTSQKTKGSILGDKTRMEKLASHGSSFIRPSPSGEMLGGVAASTREVMLLCEAAGYDVIIVETVGVGQSETSVHDLVDFFLLLMLTGAGDELQGIKKGILEVADLVAINKADGDNIASATRTKKQLEMIFEILHHDREWQPRVLTCSALQNQGLDLIWETLQEFEKADGAENSIGTLRKGQNLKWMHDYVRNRITKDFYDNPRIVDALPGLEKEIEEDVISPLQAGRRLLQIARDHDE